MTRDFTCSCCDAPLSGMYDITFDHPDHWPHGNRHESGLDVMQVGPESLSSELCEMVDDDYCVRCVLPIPIQGSEETFRFGCWASMSKASYTSYKEAVAADDYSRFDACFGWLMNELPGFPALDVSAFIPCNIHFENNVVRPELWAHKDTHPLADAQRNGITFDQLLDIYAASGNDLRPHLFDS